MYYNSIFGGSKYSGNIPSQIWKKREEDLGRSKCEKNLALKSHWTSRNSPSGEHCTGGGTCCHSLLNAASRCRQELVICNEILWLIYGSIVN